MSRPREVARDIEVVEMLRGGARAHEIAARYGLSADYSRALCRRLRREHSLPREPPAPPAQGQSRRRKRPAESPDAEHIDAVRELRRHLGTAWLTAELGADGGFDDGQMLEALQLSAALRVVLLEAEDHLDVVRARLRERAKGHLDHQATGRRADTP